MHYGLTPQLSPNLSSSSTERTESIHPTTMVAGHQRSAVSKRDTEVVVVVLVAAAKAVEGRKGSRSTPTYHATAECRHRRHYEEKMFP
jgi:hypothetical protein